MSYQFTYKALAGFIIFSNYNVKYFLFYWKSHMLEANVCQLLNCHRISELSRLIAENFSTTKGTGLTIPTETKNQHICFCHFWHCLDPEQPENTALAVSELAEIAATAKGETVKSLDVRNTKWHATGNITLSFPCCLF